jgi:Lrp/AsnC family transcriptional regulator, leucine-responsive regulatory protein
MAPRKEFMSERTLAELDAIDRKILAVLQNDGRIANADLARQINLSQTPTLERVRRLERDGFIERYAALLSPEKMQAAMTAFVEVVLDRTTEDVLDHFAAAARGVPEIVECHLIAGGFDYLLKIRVRDMPAYRQFMGSDLAQLPGIRATHTYMVMEKIKEDVFFAVGQTTPAPRLQAIRNVGASRA